MFPRDNEQLNNILQGGINATANAHQKYIDALEQRLKDKDAEIERLQKHIQEGIDLAKQIPEMVALAQVKAVKEFIKILKEKNHGALSYCAGWVDFDDIDDAKKEMVGDK